MTPDILADRIRDLDAQFRALRRERVRTDEERAAREKRIDALVKRFTQDIERGTKT